jgi:hypothetical protein
LNDLEVDDPSVLDIDNVEDVHQSISLMIPPAVGHDDLLDLTVHRRQRRLDEADARLPRMSWLPPWLSRRSARRPSGLPHVHTDLEERRFEKMFDNMSRSLALRKRLPLADDALPRHLRTQSTSAACVRKASLDGQMVFLQTDLTRRRSGLEMG